MFFFGKDKRQFVHARLITTVYRLIQSMNFYPKSSILKRHFNFKFQQNQ